jgi:ribosome-associated toxin RatA of RatAB toxin-antitoxin module
MTTKNTITQPKRLLRKAVKVLSFGSVLVIAVLVVAHFAWKYSGSNKWELVLEQNGVKVYALKSPGSTLKRFKAVARINTTLNRVVAAMTDTSTEACAAFVPGCTSGEISEPWNTHSLYYIQAYHVDFPFPFSDRDFVIKTQFSQDLRNKAVLVQCTALPDKLPQNVHSFQVTDMHNSWQFTPLENGEIEVEFLANYDLGMPYFMFNNAVPGTLSDLLPRLEGLFNKDKYQHAEFAFVKEP